MIHDTIHPPRTAESTIIAETAATSRGGEMAKGYHRLSPRPPKWAIKFISGASDLTGLIDLVELGTSKEVKKRLAKKRSQESKHGF